MEKVLFICSTMNTGGAPKIISNITTRFPEDWEVDILLNSDEDIQFPYKGNIISLNIKEPKSRTGFFYQGKVFIKRFKMLLNLKKRNQYKACISFMDSANVVNILTGNKNCEVIINIVNNMSAQGENEFIYRWIVNPLSRLLYNRANKIVALSEEVKKDMIDHFGLKPEKLSAIYCSIDLNDIEQKISQEIPGQEKEWFDNKRTVVTAGRMEKQKGQWHLIRAFSKVVKTVPDAKLVIFGFGMLDEYLKKLVQDYHMEQNVLFHGFTNQLNTYIANSAIFAFPSVYEGFGTALQEALACNIACIATDYVSGAREQLAPDYVGTIHGYLKADYGIVVEQCSKEMYDASVPLDSSEIGMADAIIELLHSDELRFYYAKKAKERSRIYDVERICQQWIELIEK